VLIRIWVRSTQPLTGTAATKGSGPLHFDGWLELLRVISQLVVTDPPARENQTGKSADD
jgi:hypothetical protein